MHKKNWIWDLETVLPIDPKEAWRRLLSGEELCPEPRAEEVVDEARTQTERAEPRAPAEDSRQTDSDVRAMETQEPQPMQWASDSDEDVGNNGNNALGSFVQRQLDACLRHQYSSSVYAFESSILPDSPSSTSPNLQKARSNDLMKKSNTEIR